jgi:large subunit ribosomal protein L11
VSKKIVDFIKIQIPAGKANPAPPIGPALGQRGINIMAFCKEFNDRTKNQSGWNLPTVITVYADKSFSFITKSPPASDLLKKHANIKKGSNKPGSEFCGEITTDQIKEILKLKITDLNAFSEDAAINIIKGSARSMGLKIID